jgi:AraC-like DNA-binding protein
MTLSLVNTVEFAHLIDLLDEVASPTVVNRALEAADITRSLVSETRGFVPYRLEAGVIEHVARSIGDPYLGARIAPQFEYSAYAAYARYVLCARDLGTALKRGRDAFPLIQVGSEIVLQEDGDLLLAGRRSRISNVVGHHHLDDGGLFIFVRLIRHFLGAEWRPAWVGATGNGDKRLQYLEDKIGALVRGGAEMPFVALEAGALGTPNPRPPNPHDIVTLSDLPVLMGVIPPRTMTNIVEQTIQSRITIGDASEDDVAACLSVGRRTLQRGLQKEGTSFREIKVRVIERRARTLLTETDLNVATIARSLGYEEPKSFQRAFRKWTGLSPHAYRKVRSDAYEVGV